MDLTHMRNITDTHRQMGMLHLKNGITNNSPKQPTSPVSTHGEVVETNTSEAFDTIWFDPSDNMPSAIKTYGTSTT